MLKDTNQEKGEIVVQTPEQILKQAVLDIKKLDEESEKALELKDGEAAKNKLIQRARIVAEIPEKVSQAEASTGIRVPEDEMDTLRSLQYIAQEALERGNGYELGLILLDMRAKQKIGELNLLEQLVNRLYPQKPD